MTGAKTLEQDVARLLTARMGLKPDLSFRPRLARVLRELTGASNIELERLASALATDSSLLDDLLDRVTVQETGFFRHPDQFEAVARVVLPKIEGPPRAWSAASANGQEAYSLAMLFSEESRPGSVLASDISPAALQRTREARYFQREMRGVSAERRRRHFVPSGDGWVATSALRDMVAVQRHNLIDPIPRQVATCHIVMCRNVLIYFSQQHAKLFLDRLADAMDPAAVLFVGGAETLWQMTDRFDPIQIGTCYAYRPRARGAIRTRAEHGSAARTPPNVAAPAPTALTAPTARPQVTATEPRLDDTGTEDELLGRQLLAAGSIAEAIVAFRRWSYLCPDDPLAHFQLGVALARDGNTANARRAYRAALAALDQCDTERLATVLEGYGAFEFRRLLVARSENPTDSDESSTPSAEPGGR